MGNPNRHGFQGYNQGNPSGYNNRPPGFNQGRNFNQGSGWRNQGNQYKEPRNQPLYQHPSQGPSQQEKLSLSIEEMLLSFIQETRASTQETKAFIQETRSHQKSTDAAIRNLETQLGQLAHERAERPTRTFGANSENNLREECKAVMTQAQKNTQEAGTMIEDDGTEDKKEEETKEEEKLEEEEKVVSPPNTKSQKARKAKNEESPVLPQDLLYPKVSTKKNKEHCFMRFLEIFKGLEITMPFGEALQQISSLRRGNI